MEISLWFLLGAKIWIYKEQKRNEIFVRFKWIDVSRSFRFEIPYFSCGPLTENSWLMVLWQWFQTVNHDMWHYNMVTQTRQIKLHIRVFSVLVLRHFWRDYMFWSVLNGSGALTQGGTLSIYRDKFCCDIIQQRNKNFRFFALLLRYGQIKFVRNSDFFENYCDTQRRVKRRKNSCCVNVTCCPLYNWDIAIFMTLLILSWINKLTLRKYYALCYWVDCNVSWL